MDKLKIIERLRELSDAVLDEDKLNREISFRVPPDENRCPDLVLANAANIIESHDKQIAELKAELEEKSRFIDSLHKKNDELEKENQGYETDLTKALEERDLREEWADKLAYEIAEIEDIGEHSSANCPWPNAVEFLHQERQENEHQLNEYKAYIAKFRDISVQLSDAINGDREEAWEYLSWLRSLVDETPETSLSSIQADVIEQFFSSLKFEAGDIEAYLMHNSDYSYSSEDYEHAQFDLAFIKDVLIANKINQLRHQS